MRVFGEFWKLSVRNNDPSPKKTKIGLNINGVGKAHCMLSFLSGGLNEIEQAQRAKHFFEKMIGRL